MTEATDQTTPTPPPSVGQQVDRLVSEAKDLAAAIVRHSRDLAAAQDSLTMRCDALTDVVGRPTAAKLLGITPRQLAQILRTSKWAGR